jgi:hypothetical protein
MMNRLGALAASATLLAAGIAFPANPKIVPRVTGEMLVEYYVGKRGVQNPELDANAFVKQQFAKGYLAGVADAAQGKDWCDKGQAKTGEIDAAVVRGLRELPPQELRKDASALVIDLLRKRFPCS